MRKLLAVLILIAIPVFYFLYLYPSSTPFYPVVVDDGRPVVRVGDVSVRVEVADTDELRRIGLGGRDSLGATSGMFFVFDKSGYHQFWMKDVHFLIDIIWIGEDLTVVDITPKLSPDTFPQIFEPKVPARFVLETNANYAESFGIKIGDKVTLPKDLIPKDLQK